MSRHAAESGPHAPVVHQRVESLFVDRGWVVAPFQREAWDAYRAGRDGLIHSPTGSGKTLAAWLGPVMERLEDPTASNDDPIRVVWITPLRALANDTGAALQDAASSLGLGWTVEIRTGDTSSSIKARQRKKLPPALVTTPESLTLLLTYPETARQLRGLRCVVCDEWHELMSTKRGVQTELAIARLRSSAPGLRVWGISATLGNIDVAARVLAGSRGPAPALVRGGDAKPIEVECVLPEHIERYPWAGHLGVKLADRVVGLIGRASSTLLFTNTRSQAELWFRELVRRSPDLIGGIALHHGSLDRDLRNRVEAMLKGESGGLRCVVSTSSLDLGVDFAPVDQVIQVGSPKGIARMVQRAGRSGHRPGAVSRIVGVPTYAMELIEFAGVRDAIARGELESRDPIEKPLDVLVQHLVTVSMAEGFDERSMREEIRSTWAFRGLSDDEWAWAMSFVRRGGAALAAYPEFARVTEQDGVVRVASRAIGQRHRLNIGTIVSDDAVRVAFANGKTVGSVEESFIARLRIGDRFVLAGRVLELRRLREMTATVERARSVRGAVPRWNGGKMPLSTQLADAVLDRLRLADGGVFDAPEMACVRPLLDLQRTLSVIPTRDILLLEHATVRGRHHVFLFPFAGRLAHEGLGAVLSLRLSRREPRSVTAVVNDYGIELSCDTPIETDPDSWRSLLEPAGLLRDLIESVNAAEFARRQFRGIARVAGLTQQGFPGRTIRTRHLQASSDMFYDVLREFDPGNLLLSQAQQEVLAQQLEFDRLQRALRLARARRLTVVETPDLSPIAFPLYAESLRATTVTSEPWEDRVKRLADQMDRRARGAGARR